MKTQAASKALLTAILAALLFGLQGPVDLAAAGIPDPRFGVVEAYEAPGAAAQLGAGWTRVTFRWNEIQPNGPQEWNVAPISDETLSRELAHGREVVGLLVTTPGWATDLDVGPGVPKGLHLPADDPANLWAGFVRTIVNRYAGRIDRWIIWNEPDIPDTQHMSWGGSTQDFVRLLQVAYTVSKQTNPSARIHMAAVTHWWNEDWFGQFLDALVSDPNAAANNFYFDVATLHVYFQPETVYDITVHYGDMMRGHGIHKPIWIAETNAAPSSDPAWPVPNAQFQVSLEQQAAYIVQAFSLGIAAGAERLAVYKMADTETDRQANPEPFGLVRLDGGPRPAFSAYQVATTYMAGFRSGRWERRDAISVVTIDRGDQTTTVTWARTAEPQTAMIPARTTRALLTGPEGNARYVYPERGYYYVDLPGAHCPQGCKIGGTPYLLIEEARAGASTAPTPQSPTPAPSQTAEPADTSASDASPTHTPAPEGTVTHAPATSTATPSTTNTRTPTASATPSTTPTPTCRRTSVPTASPTPTSTSRPSPPPAPSVTPSPSPTPASSSLRSGDRAWILLGVMLIGLVGTAMVANGREI